MIRRFLDWLAGGRTVLEVVVGCPPGMENPLGRPAGVPAPDSAIRERFTLTCATCGVLYLPRPDETIHPINRCRTCATKEAESAA